MNASTPEGPPSVADRQGAEQWFRANGLPYFVDDTRERVRRGLSRPRLLAVGLALTVVALVVGLATGQVDGDASLGVASGLQAALLVAAAYGWTTLRGGSIARWAARHTMRSLGMLFPLVTRALPLLLLFITFLFINTEVWMVAEALDGGVMGVAVLLFAAVSVGFLLVRLPEEVSRFDGLDHELVADGCAGTPMAQWAHLDTAPGIDEPMGGLERGNLVLALLVSQAIQVLLLSVSVFAFFLVFGAVTMDPDVVEAWIGTPPTPVLGQGLVTRELVQVSTFLASFAGLYFTVYAVTDEAYRSQFFTAVTSELERAVSAREVYRAMVRIDPTA